MRLLVVGATGGTGSAVLNEALKRGHQVTAMVRSPAAIRVQHVRLNVRDGDPRNGARLAAELDEHEAVISTLGPRRRRERGLLPECARSLVEAAASTGVRRIVVMSSWLCFRTSERSARSTAGPGVAWGR